MSTKILISVVGPTAIGKTRLAIALAQHYKTEIISADSRQFFKEMCIGTAVPSPEELNTITHHFIQHKSIFEDYSVGDFEKDALKKLKKLFQNKDVVVMVGGSGLYVDAVVRGLDTFPPVDSEIRAQLNERLKNKGIESLQKQLKSLDETYYEKVDIENPHRLIRALEICIGTGRPYSSYLNQEKTPRDFKTIYIGLEAERDVIYDRINKRVDLMLEDGLLKEAEPLLEHKSLNALQTVGYRELFNFLENKWSLEFAVSEIKKNTRRFAKRQLTWYRKNSSIFRVNYNEDYNKIINNFKKHLLTELNG